MILSEKYFSVQKYDESLVFVDKRVNNFDRKQKKIVKNFIFIW